MAIRHRLTGFAFDSMPRRRGVQPSASALSIRTSERVQLVPTEYRTSLAPLVLDAVVQQIQENETREWLIAVAAVLGAVFTTLAVLYALYRDSFREWRQRPKLTLHFEPEERDTNRDLVTITDNAGRPQHWARLRVENARHRHPATDVELLVTDLRSLAAGITLEAIDTRPFHWSVVGGSTLSIQSGVARHVDLLSLGTPYDRPSPSDGQQALLPVHLAVDPEPSGDRHLLPAGEYELSLVLAARDISARRFNLKVEWAGTWWADSQVWDHLRISDLQSV